MQAVENHLYNSPHLRKRDERVPESDARLIEFELIRRRRLASRASSFQMNWQPSAEVTRITIRSRVRHCGVWHRLDESMTSSSSLSIRLSPCRMLVTSVWLSFFTSGSFPCAALSGAPFLVLKVFSYVQLLASLLIELRTWIQLLLVLFHRVWVQANHSSSSPS